MSHPLLKRVAVEVPLGATSCAAAQGGCKVGLPAGRHGEALPKLLLQHCLQSLHIITATACCSLSHLLYKHLGFEELGGEHEGLQSSMECQAGLPQTLLP